MTELLERDSELAAIETFVRRGGVMLIEAGAGVGKTSLLEAACAIARREKRVVLRARGSDLERDFAFGIARQLFEHRCADATADERDALFAGPARAVVTLFQRDDSSSAEQDTGFAVLHGLYWLTINLADHAPLLRREGLSAQRIRTWKSSKDPHFDRKKNSSDASTARVRSAPR